MLLLVTIMYGVLAYFLSMGLIALFKQSRIAFSSKPNYVLVFDDISYSLQHNSNSVGVEK